MGGGDGGGREREDGGGREREDGGGGRMEEEGGRGSGRREERRNKYKSHEMTTFLEEWTKKLEHIICLGMRHTLATWK